MTRKRVKPEILVILDLKHAEEVLGQIAGLKRMISTTNTEMNASVAAIKKTAEGKVKLTQKELEKLEIALVTFANRIKHEQFEEKRSVELLYGTIGFRRASEIKQATNTKAAMVIDNINTKLRLAYESDDPDEIERLSNALRMKVEINKEAMRGWSDAQLEGISLRRIEIDAFYYEIREETLEGAA